MKVLTLIENRVSRKRLVAEHGLSFYIEANGNHVLFDTGAGSNFLHNASVLGIDISKIDFLIISHGHGDHIGGLNHFLEMNGHARIFLKEEAILPKLKNETYIGSSSKTNWNNSQFRFIKDVIEVVPDVFIVPTIDIHFPSDQHKDNFYTEKDGVRIPDEFNDELFLVLKNTKGNSIISSCSHNGISNIVNTALQLFKEPVKNVIGGFHLKDDTQNSAEQISEYFNEIEVENVYTGHCTGVEKFAQIQTLCLANVFYNETGNEIEL